MSDYGINSPAIPKEGKYRKTDLYKYAGMQAARVGAGFTMAQSLHEKVTVDWPDKIAKFQKSENALVKFFFAVDNIPKGGQKFLDIYEKTLSGVSILFGLVPNAVGFAAYGLDALIKEHIDKLRRDGKLSNEQLLAMYEDEDKFISENREFFTEGLFADSLLSRVLPEFLIGLGNEALNDQITKVNGVENLTNVLLAGKFTENPVRYGLVSKEATEYINIRSVALENILTRKLPQAQQQINTPANRDEAIRQALNFKLNGVALPNTNPIINLLNQPNSGLTIDELVGNYDSAHTKAREYLDSILDVPLLKNTNVAEIGAVVDSKVRELKSFLNVNNNVPNQPIQRALLAIVNSYRSTGNAAAIQARVEGIMNGNPPNPNTEEWYLVEIFKLSNRNIVSFIKDFLEKPTGQLESNSLILKSNYLAGIANVDQKALMQLNIWIDTLSDIDNPQQVLVNWRDICAMNQPNVLNLTQTIVNQVATDIGAFTNYVPPLLSINNAPPAFILRYLKGILQGENLEVLRFNLIREVILSQIPQNHPQYNLLVNNFTQYNPQNTTPGSYSTEFFEAKLGEGVNNFPTKAYAFLLSLVAKSRTNQPLQQTFQNISFTFLGDPPRTAGPLQFNNITILDPAILATPAGFIAAYDVLLKAYAKWIDFDKAVKNDEIATRRLPNQGAVQPVKQEQLQFFNNLNSNNPEDALFILLHFKNDPGQPGNASLTPYITETNILTKTNRDYLVGNDRRVSLITALQDKAKSPLTTIERIRRAKTIDKDSMVEIYSFLGLPPNATKEAIATAMRNYNEFIAVGDRVFVPNTDGNNQTQQYTISPNYSTITNSLAQVTDKESLKAVIDSGVLYTIDRKFRTSPAVKAAAIAGDFKNEDLKKLLDDEAISAIKILKDALPVRVYNDLISGALNRVDNTPITADELTVIFAAFADPRAAISSYAEMKRKVSQVRAVIGTDTDAYSFLEQYNSALSNYFFDKAGLGVNSIEREHAKTSGTNSHFFVLDVPEPLWSNVDKVRIYSSKLYDRYNNVKTFFTNSLNLPAADPRSISSIAQNLRTFTAGNGLLGVRNVRNELTSLMPSSPIDASAMDHTLYLLSQYVKQNPQPNPANFVAQISNSNWALETLGIVTGRAKHDNMTKRLLVAQANTLRGLLGNNGSVVSQLIQTYSSDFYPILNYIFYTFRNHGASTYTTPSSLRSIDAFLSTQSDAEMETLLRNRHQVLTSDNTAASPLTDLIKRSQELMTSSLPIENHNKAIIEARNARIFSVLGKESGITQGLRFTFAPGKGKSPAEFRESGFGLTK